MYLPISSRVTKPARATVLGQSHRDCLTPYWYLFKTLPGILWTEPFLVLKNKQQGGRFKDPKARGVFYNRPGNIK